jgi:hypothetical protein
METGIDTTSLFKKRQDGHFFPGGLSSDGVMNLIVSEWSNE